MSPRSTSRTGFTLIEVILVMALLALVVGKGVGIARSSLSSATVTSAQINLEDQARMTLDRLAIAIQGSDRETLTPAGEGVHLTELSYRVSLGVHDGEVIWADPEELGLGEGPGQVVWKENPGAAEERRVIWSNLARPLLGGELMNGMDDNGNGLIDEDGLSFVVEGNAVWIRLSLQRTTGDGETITETVGTVVAIRN